MCAIARTRAQIAEILFLSRCCFFSAIRGIGNWFREWILRYLDGVFFFGFYRGISRESCLYEGNFDNV